MATPVGPATMLWNVYKKWIIGGIAVLILGCCLLVGLTAFVANRATLAANPVFTTTQAAPATIESPLS